MNVVGITLTLPAADISNQVLIMAMVASFAIKSFIEGGVITFVILLNIVVGFFQEYSAEKTLSSIRALGSPTARVIRQAVSQVIPTKELVPGDIVELVSGSTVPADLRMVETVNLEADEALLTGESLPVAKNSHDVFDVDTGAGDRLNMTFSSSTITKGRGRGVVVATVSRGVLNRSSMSNPLTIVGYVHRDWQDRCSSTRGQVAHSCRQTQRSRQSRYPSLHPGMVLDRTGWYRLLLWCQRWHASTEKAFLARYPALPHRLSMRTDR